MLLGTTKYKKNDKENKPGESIFLLIVFYPTLRLVGRCCSEMYLHMNLDWEKLRYCSINFGHTILSDTNKLFQYISWETGFHLIQILKSVSYYVIMK